MKRTHSAIRFAAGEVYRLDGRAPSFTDMKKGGDCFYIVTMPCEGTLAEFNAAAKARSAAQTAFLEQDAETDALIYFSCLPWMDVTSVTNARNFAAQGAADLYRIVTSPATLVWKNAAICAVSIPWPSAHMSFVTTASVVMSRPGMTPQESSFVPTS